MHNGPYRILKREQQALRPGWRDHRHRGYQFLDAALFSENDHSPLADEVHMLMLVDLSDDKVHRRDGYFSNVCAGREGVFKMVGFR